MADHPRKVIRQHVVDLLTGAIAAVGTRVFKTRTYAVQTAEVPAICVYTLRETSEDLDLDGTLDRSVNLAIEIYARDREAPDDELDDLCQAVEDLMGADQTLGGTALDNRLAETLFGYDSEGRAVAGMARLRYAVRYQT